jgi:hypothetical protein
VIGLPPTHAPFWQVSVWVQELPSLHAVPFGCPVQAPQASTIVAVVHPGITQWPWAPE